MAARELDPDVRDLEEALQAARETARSSPLRRPGLSSLNSSARGARHLDFAVRNTRVLARQAPRFPRADEDSAPQPGGGRAPARACRLGTGRQFEDPARKTELRRHPSEAAARALSTHEPGVASLLGEIVEQVRSTVIDLTGASNAVAPEGGQSSELTTEELRSRARARSAAGGLTAIGQPPAGGPDWSVGRGGRPARRGDPPAAPRARARGRGSAAETGAAPADRRHPRTGLPEQDAIARDWLARLPGRHRTVLGNHDIMRGRSVAAWARAYGLDSQNFVVDLPFVRLIAIGRAGAGEGRRSGLLSEETLDWLSRRLARSERGCWIACHWPLRDTVGGDPHGTSPPGR